MLQNRRLIFSLYRNQQVSIVKTQAECKPTQAECSKWKTAVGTSLKESEKWYDKELYPEAE